jgi:hypothetical protein
MEAQRKELNGWVQSRRQDLEYVHMACIKS